MAQLLTLSATFSVQEEDQPDLSDILWTLESRLRQLDGVFDCASDVTEKTRGYQIVVEVEGEGRVEEISSAADDALREVVGKFFTEPAWGDVLVDEVD